MSLMPKISFPGCLSLSPATLKMCALAKNFEKFTKKPFMEVQGYSRSSMLINLKCPSPVLVMISSMYVPICNRFHSTWTNSSKINHFLGGTPLWRLRAQASLNSEIRDVDC